MQTASTGDEPAGSSGSEPPSPAASDSSSDFEIQAVTTADGVRTQSAPSAAETEAEKSDAPPRREALRQLVNEEPVERKAVGLPEANESNVNRSVNQEPRKANALGLDAYADSSSEGERDAGSNSKPQRSVRKRVRFADDVPSKRSHAEQLDGPLNGHLEANPDEAAILLDLAKFEEAVVDAGRDADDIEADLVEAEDAQDEVLQRELEERVRRLRERVRLVSDGVGPDGRDSLDDDDDDDDDEEEEEEEEKKEEKEEEVGDNKEVGAKGEGEEDNEEQSDDEIDLMRDWMTG